MSWRPHGRAIVNPDCPSAFGICDRCGALYNLKTLRYQHQWAGTALINKRVRVCDTCMDVPSAFLRTIVLPPDPVPVIDPRTEPYSIDEAGSFGDDRIGWGGSSQTEYLSWGDAPGNELTWSS